MAVSNIVSLFRARPSFADWSNQELAEFYRVESALISVGFLVDTDRGLSDEGEPWFIFIDGMSDEVIVHCARIDGAYVIASAAFDGVLRGPSFRTLVETFLERHPLVLPPADTQEKKSNIRLHPAAFLVALVATAFFKLSATDASASELDSDDSATDGTHVPGHAGEQTRLGMELDKRQTMAVLAAVAVVTSQLRSDVDVGATEFQTSRSISSVEADTSNPGDGTPDFPGSLKAHAASRDAMAGDVIVSGFQTVPFSRPDGTDSVLDAVISDAFASSDLLGDLLMDDAPLTPRSFSTVELSGVTTEVGGFNSYSSGMGITLGSSDASGIAHEVMQRVAEQMTSPEHARASSQGEKGLPYGRDASPQHSTPQITVNEGSISFEPEQGPSLRDRSTGSTSVTVTPAPEQPAAQQPAETPLPAPAPQPEHQVDTNIPEAKPEIDVANILNAIAPQLDVSINRIHYTDDVHAFDDRARTLINDFVSKDINSTTITHGSDVVVIDSNLSRYWKSDISFVTWSFEDGSTISLIGVFDYEHAA